MYLLVVKECVLEHKLIRHTEIKQALSHVIGLETGLVKGKFS